jgi:hypothetical protein
MTEPAPLERLVFDLAVDLLRVEDLPEIACGVLMDGPDSPGLRLLAALGPGDVRQDPRHAWDLLRQAIEELGLEIPSFCDALAFQVRAVARKLAIGQCTVREAANAMDSLAFTGRGWRRCPEVPLVEFAIDADSLAAYERAGDRAATDRLEADVRRRLLALLDEPA